MLRTCPSENIQQLDKLYYKTGFFNQITRTYQTSSHNSRGEPVFDRSVRMGFSQPPNHQISVALDGEKKNLMNARGSI